MTIRYCGYTGYSGYGYAARNYIAAILRAGYSVHLEPLDIFPEKNQALYPYNQVTVGGKFDPNSLSILHAIPEQHRRLRKTTKTLAIAAYETWDPPAHWFAILNECDGIIVPSKFNLEIFKELKKPLYYVPHCIDLEQYTPDVAPLYKYDKFTFLFLGTWRHRKGYRELIEAWNFSPKEAQLIIKTDKPSDAQNYIRTASKSSSIFVATQRYTDQEMPGFIKSAHCLVIPSLGEAFCYPSLQSMALGVPVLVTNHSGFQEYATPDTATLLEPEGVIECKTMDGIPQFSNKKWINISSSQIAEKLQYVFSHPKETKEKSFQGSLYVKSKFGYNQASESLGRIFDNYL